MSIRDSDTFFFFFLGSMKEPVVTRQIATTWTVDESTFFCEVLPTYLPMLLQYLQYLFASVFRLFHKRTRTIAELPPAV